MSVTLTDELAEAALRAAATAGSKSVVEGLLSAGVKASALRGIAVEVADFYGHSEVAQILRTAIRKETSVSAIRPPDPSPR
jgi:hypothetical protein